MFSLENKISPTTRSIVSEIHAILKFNAAITTFQTVVAFFFLVLTVPGFYTQADLAKVSGVKLGHIRIFVLHFVIYK